MLQSRFDGEKFGGKDRASAREILLLESHLVQEQVLVDQLRASEAAQEQRIRAYQASLASYAMQGMRMSREDGSNSGPVACHNNNNQPRQKLQLINSAGNDPLELALHLDDLERVANSLAETLRQRHLEAEIAEKTVADLQEQVLDESSNMGMLLMPSGRFDGKALLADLASGLPPSHPVRKVSGLEEAMMLLEEERDVVHEVLTGSRGGEVKAARQDVEQLRRQLARLQEEENEKASRLEAVQAEMRDSDELNEIDDCLAEASMLRKESGLLRRHQAEWQRSEYRMVALLKDASGRSKESKGQSPMLSPSEDPSHELREVLRRNSLLQERVQELEQEKMDLVHSQQGLISFIKSKMPLLENGAAHSQVTGGHSYLSAYPPSP